MSTKRTRDIVKIDREKCTGCGACVTGCKEGALQVIDGKAVLVSETLCDGLGACIGECPEGAITIERREAEPYDEAKAMVELVRSGKNTVVAHMQHLMDHEQHEYLQQAFAYLHEHEAAIPFDIADAIGAVQPKAAGGGCGGCKSGGGDGQHASPPSGCPGSASRSFAQPAGGAAAAAAAAAPTLGCGCPGSAARSFAPKDVCHASSPAAGGADQPSSLTHWPVQMSLINPAAPHFRGSNVLLSADCVAYAMGAAFHSQYLKGKTLTIACPKLDSPEAKQQYIAKIAALIDEAQIDTLTVMRMEVPCCGGLTQIALAGRAAAQRHIPIKVIIVGVQGGQIIDSKWM